VDGKLVQVVCCVEYKDFWPGGPEFCPTLFITWYMSVPRMSCVLTCIFFVLVNTSLIVMTCFCLFVLCPCFVSLYNTLPSVSLCWQENSSFTAKYLLPQLWNGNFFSLPRPTCLVKSGNLYTMHYALLTYTLAFILVTSGCEHWYCSSVHL
jgi:hypothetical protein